METIIPIFLVILFLGFLLSRLDRNDDSGADADENTLRYNDAVNSIYDSAARCAEENIKQDEIVMNQELPKDDTFELMLRALSNLGCQPTTDEEGTISVAYQGENFKIRCNGVYARIWDPYWAAVKADDPDLKKVMEAVIGANYCLGPKLVLSEMDDNGNLYMSSLWDIVFHPALPSKANYIKNVLDTFFDAKEELRRCYCKLEAKKEESSKNHPPVSVKVNNHTCWLN